MDKINDIIQTAYPRNLLNEDTTVFNVVCRGSWLSLAQVEIFKNKVAQKFPLVSINIIIKESAGDKNQSTPLHLVEGKDFFTKDIQDALKNGEADFAIHSMKDVSGEDFFNESVFAIIDREDLRDVAIFNGNILNKLQHKDKIIIGTSSPRRSNMATEFLKNALPQLNETSIDIEAVPIRGNVDVRLQKLHDGLYDGIILAVAGLNRLLNYQPSKDKIQFLLDDKRKMILPLFECPPAAGQGAIVVETAKTNIAAIEILNAVKDEQLTNAIKNERKFASKYGYGCSQQFGAFHLDQATISFTYAAGKNIDNNKFTEWDFTANLPLTGKEIFSSANYMKDFFSYKYTEINAISTSISTVFVASHKAIHTKSFKNILAEKNIWAAGTKTWLQLAQMGIWVDGCADGLGLESILTSLQGNLIAIHKEEIQVLTNTQSALHWHKEGWNVQGTYSLIPKNDKAILQKITQADIVFWTSFQQYQQYKHHLKLAVTHVCLPGKTAVLLLTEGITPVIFPSIKALNEWIKKNIIPTIAE